MARSTPIPASPRRSSTSRSQPKEKVPSAGSSSAHENTPDGHEVHTGLAHETDVLVAKPMGAIALGCSPRRSGCVHSPAIAPKVRPLATYFCRNGNRMSIGSTDISEPRITSG